MPAHFKNTGLWAFPFYRLLQMDSAGIDPLGNSRFIKVFAGFKVMFYLPENPWVANSGPANHHTINAKLHAPRGRLLRRINIPVSKNGDLYSRVLLYFADQL